MYKTLESMGITSFEDIERFTLRSENNSDILKVYYRRQKGSFLPKSKKFKFGRARKTVLTDGGKQTYKEIEEPSLTVLSAVDELTKLVGKQNELKVTKEDLVKEMDHLERVMTDKMAEIKEKISLMS